MPGFENNTTKTRPVAWWRRVTIISECCVWGGPKRSKKVQKGPKRSNFIPLLPPPATSCPPLSGELSTVKTVLNRSSWGGGGYLMMFETAKQLCIFWTMYAFSISNRYKNMIIAFKTFLEKCFKNSLDIGTFQPVPTTSFLGRFLPYWSLEHRGSVLATKDACASTWYCRDDTWIKIHKLKSDRLET